MQWDTTPAAGFTTGEPWIAVNPNHVEINAAAQIGDPDSVLSHFRAVIELRHSDPVVALGDFTMLLPDDPTVYAFTRTYQGSTLLVLGNFSSGQARAAVPDEAEWARAELVLGNYSADDGRAAEGPAVGESTAGETTVADTSVRETAETDHIQLRPWESRIYRRSI
jgi:oligo-1,6-glucosidase